MLKIGLTGTIVTAICCFTPTLAWLLALSGLASWLRASRDAASNTADEAEALRLESDAHAVQLVTIHKSKGLEYPVVLFPFGWADRKPKDQGEPLEWHATGQLASIDVGSRKTYKTAYEAYLLIRDAEWS